MSCSDFGISRKACVTLLSCDGVFFHSKQSVVKLTQGLTVVKLQSSFQPASYKKQLQHTKASMRHFHKQTPLKNSKFSILEIRMSGQHVFITWFEKLAQGGDTRLKQKREK